MTVLKKSLAKFEEFVSKGALEEGIKTIAEREKNIAEGWFIEGYAHGFEAAQMPPPPMECKTDAEKIAYAHGWFKALELNPARKLWVGLTEEDKADILNRKWWDFEDTFDVDGFLRLTEAKLKEKNT